MYVCALLACGAAFGAGGHLCVGVRLLGDERTLWTE